MNSGADVSNSLTVRCKLKLIFKGVDIQIDDAASTKNVQLLRNIEPVELAMILMIAGQPRLSNMAC